MNKLRGEGFTLLDKELWGKLCLKCLPGERQAIIIVRAFPPKES